MGHDKNHDFAGADHNADTFANVDGKISDGTLVNADGLSGGQTINGGTGALETLTLQASSNAARGPVEVDGTVLRVTNTPGPEGGCFQLKMPNGNSATFDSETNTSTRVFVTEAVDHTFTLFNNGAGVMNFSLLGEQTITNGTDATGSGGSLTDGDLLTTGGVAVQKSLKVQTTIEAGQELKGSAVQVLADESWGLTGDAGVVMSEIKQTAVEFYKGSATLPITRSVDVDNDPVIEFTKNSATAGDSTTEIKGFGLIGKAVVESETGAYSIVAADNSKVKVIDAPLTIPTGLDIGFQCAVFLDNATKQTITTTGLTVKGKDADASISGNGTISILVIATDTVLLVGDMEA